MAKNYARESGSFMALAKMMRDEIRKLDSTDDFDQKWAVRFLQGLANQTDATLVEFGYKVD
jgi:CelD/BcsL family acetyltransferase involved in cellulose biosynthesis